MMDLRRLRTFREVMTRRSFSAAALALDYTQSSVSQQVAALEKELGVTLVDRVRRPIGPTPAGELVLARADALLGHAQAVEQELAELARGMTGTLRLGGFFTAWATFMPGAVEVFARSHPGVGLELQQIEPAPAGRALVAGELDLAVLYIYEGQQVPDGLEATALLEDRYAVAVPRRHPLAKKDAIELGDLAAERWVLPPATSPYAALVRRLCAERAGFEPAVSFETDDIAMAQPLVAAGLAVAMLPALGLVPRHAGVAVRPLGGAVLAREVVAARPAHRRAPATAAMTDALVRTAGAQARQAR